MSLWAIYCCIGADCVASEVALFDCAVKIVFGCHPYSIQTVVEGSQVVDVWQVGRIEWESAQLRQNVLFHKDIKTGIWQFFDDCADDYVI